MSAWQHDLKYIETAGAVNIFKNAYVIILF